MNTSATNKRLGDLMGQIDDGSLVPDPNFQRRLVWSNKHKNAFIATVLDGLPFPEIFIALSGIHHGTGKSKSLLVDGQQRITTLHQYFKADPSLKLENDIRPYIELQDEEKNEFLQYEVVIRDLGIIGIEKVKDIFKRINSTNYALNTMEIQSSRYDGEFKKFGESLSENIFFEKHKIFTTNEIRRMLDVRFCLLVVVTTISTYFNREVELEEYLKNYNDEFKEKNKIEKGLNKTIQFIEDCDFKENSRVWKKADLFTLLVELNRALIKEKLELDPKKVSKRLEKFYSTIGSVKSDKPKVAMAAKYHQATFQASNDRNNRIVRGEIIYQIITGNL